MLTYVNTSERADQEQIAADVGRSALLQLLGLLREADYRFVTATPGTHARVLRRPDRQQARSLRDVLGWSLPFKRDLIDPAIIGLLERAGRLTERPDGLLHAEVRVSSIDDALFLHSRYPTNDYDSVFLGPDSYRFALWIAAKAGELPPGASILDYGAGAGVGGITAALMQRGPHLTLADINQKALFLASINAEAAGIPHRTVEVQRPAAVEGSFDLIVTHPPFMIDPEARAYRDGGDLFGVRLSLDWALEAIEKLTPGGKLILHTGVSIVDGQDVLHDHLVPRVDPARFRIAYRELDPDIFSEDLDQPGYAQVERISAVGLCITREGAGSSRH